MLLPTTQAGEGPALLCLHGGPGLSDYLHDLGSETDGWRRITYTQRGLPPSVVDGPLTVDQHVADVVTVLDGLGLDDAVVLGHSWGGFLGAMVAVTHPDRVRGLLLVDPMGVVGDGGYGAFADEMSARTPEAHRSRMEELDRRAMAGEGTEDDAVESLRLVWPAYFADPGSAPPMPALRLSVPALSQGLEEAMALLRSGTLPDRVATYDGPVEVLYGEGSPFPTAAAVATADAFADGRASGVPDAGHFPWLERPGCVREALDRLAGRLGSRRPAARLIVSTSRISTASPTLVAMRDEVDALAEAWARERADLDLGPVAVFSRISRLERRLDLARREAFTAHRVEAWEFDVLAALRRTGDPYELSPGGLMRETLVTSGTVTNRVDRLAARGLVERHPDPDDRRGVIVRLTADGKTTVDAAFEALLDAERDLLADLTPAQRTTLADLLRRLLAPLGGSTA